MGSLVPSQVLEHAKKGKVIIYRCEKCGKEIKNVVALDDDKDAIYKVVEQYAKNHR